MTYRFTPPLSERVVKKERSSNIELLRIIAMFLVLLVHSQFYSLGLPTSENLNSSAFDTILRIVTQSLSLVCVNVFVLISGWFGITFKWKGVYKLIFQWWFLAILVSVLLVAFGKNLSIVGCIKSIFSFQYYWFIYSYLLLYVLSPILNAFIKNAPKRQVEKVLLVFFIYELLFGWIKSYSDFNNGYSCVSFWGLYLLARYVSVYKPLWTKKSAYFDLGIYFSATLISALFIVLFLLFDIKGNIMEKILVRFDSYTSPFTIVAALFLLLAFSKMKFHNKVINRFAISAFAIYIIQCNPNIFDPIFKESIIKIHESLNVYLWPFVNAIYLVFFYLVCIILDQLRIICFKGITKLMHMYSHLHV